MKSVPECESSTCGNGSDLRSISEGQIQAGEMAFFHILGPMDIDAHTLRILLKSVYRNMRKMEQ